jgi:hypothetical protein
MNNLYIANDFFEYKELVDSYFFLYKIDFYKELFTFPSDYYHNNHIYNLNNKTIDKNREYIELDIIIRFNQFYYYLDYGNNYYYNYNQLT